MKMNGKKHTLAELDDGQLDLMWQFLRLRPQEQSCTVKDIESIVSECDPCDIMFTDDKFNEYAWR